MTAKLIFLVQQYSLLGVAALVFFGLGRPLIAGATQTSPAIRVPLQIAAGMGIAMIALFVSGILGQLHLAVLAILALVGLTLAIAPVARRDTMPALLARVRSLRMTIGRLPLTTWWWITIAVAVSLPLLLRPLQVPSEWDELAYHLPYARFWAEQGALTVNEWLRYPLSAYNLNLLYAAALLLGSDVLPHLLHALTGLLTAALTFGIARRFVDWKVGLVAAVLAVYSTRWGWNNAYVDLGLMLFWSCAFAALALRYTFSDARFAYLAAFFAGIAVGIKYQGLIYLPVFLAFAFIVERRPAVVIRSALVFVVVGGYWYLRNYLISGDPIHPIGGHLFGFWLWTPADLAAQHSDLDRVRGWRDWVLLPAFAAPLLWRGATPVVRGLILCAAGALLLWYLVSGYWRYLMPAYPMLAILSAAVVVALWQRAGLPSAIPKLARTLNRRLRLAVAALVLVAVATTLAHDLRKELGRVIPDGEARAQYLAKKFPGYALLRTSDDAPAKTLYQLGFEDEIYYLGTSVRGDWFGPGRYTDVMALTQDAGALAAHLAALGTDRFLVHRSRQPFANLAWDPTMAEHFDRLGQSEDAGLYRLRKTAADLDTDRSPSLPRDTD